MLLTRVEHNPPQICRLCQQPAKLSFEHIPPRSCFNNSETSGYTFDGGIRGNQDKTRYRRGLGLHALCRDCNSFGGSTYVKPYQSFVHQAHAGVESMVKPGDIWWREYTINPGLIAKQIALMATCLMHTDHDFHVVHRLRYIAKNPRTQVSLPDIRTYCYLCLPGGDPRLNGVITRLEVMGVNQVFCWSEISLPPIGLVLLGNSKADTLAARRLGLCDISSFFSYTPIEIAKLTLPLRGLQPLGMAPLDYVQTAPEAMMTIDRSIR